MTVGMLGNAYGLAGRHDEARALLEELMARRGTPRVSPAAVAAVYRGLGEIDDALGWLKKGVEERDLAIIGNLKSDPGYAALRGHPCYHALLRKMNLEP